MLKFRVTLAAMAVTLSAAADPTGSNTSSSSNTQAREAQQRTFDSLDRNGDRLISRTEAGVDRHLADDFAYVDTDGDGYISPAEYAARTGS